MDNKSVLELVKKSFNRFSLGISIDRKLGIYKVDRYCNSSDITAQFFDELDTCLKTGNKIKFYIPQDDFKGLKNAIIKGFIKENNSMNDWALFFDTFLFNFPLQSILNTLYIQPSWNGSIPNSSFKPYISFLFKQDFNYQNFNHQNFLRLFDFNFSNSANDYPELKEFLFSFVSNHIEPVKNSIQLYYSNKEQCDKNMKSFELDLYSQISRHIKLEDLKIFNQFWPSILIKSENKSMMTEVNNNFVFNLNFSYLSDNYDQITNHNIAFNTCEFINNTINENFSDSLESYILNHNETDCKFLIHFKKEFKKELLIDLFESIIQLKIDTKQFENHYLKNEYKESFNFEINSIKKQIYSYCLEFNLHKNNDKNNQPKQIKNKI